MRIIHLNIVKICTHYTKHKTPNEFNAVLKKLVFKKRPTMTDDHE